MVATATKPRFIKAAAARRFIEEFIPQDQIFTVTFLRAADRAERVMNCRRGVKVGLTGAGRRQAANVLTVFDLKLNDYRSFRLDSIVEIKGAGLVIRAS